MVLSPATVRRLSGGDMRDEQFCAKCGASVSPADNFCTSCGQRIGRGLHADSDASLPTAEDLAGESASISVQELLNGTYPVPMANRFALSRLAARWLDMALFGLPVAIIFRELGVGETFLPIAALLTVLIAYPFVEGLVTRSYKTTLGKRLLNVQLVERRESASLRDYTRRAGSAHFHGFAGGFPPFSLYAAWVSWRHFLETGRTPWDDVSPIYALPQGAGFIRWTAFVLIAVVIQILPFIPSLP